MSAKAFDALSKSADVSSAPQTAQSQEQNDNDDKEKILAARKNLIRFGSLAVLAFVVWLFATIAWFSMNRDVSTGGMGIKSQAMPYTIQTRDSSGFYKDKWDLIGSQAMEWKVSATHNFDNHEGDIPADEEEPGLEPGDSGMLEFRVNPNTSDSITVDCVFDFKIYLESPVLDQQGNQVLDDNDDPVTQITEINNETLTEYVKSHIMLFSGYDTVSGKYTGLIGTDEDLKRVLENQTYTKNDTTYTTIYWKWPMHLEELTSHDASKIIFSPSERSSVINYIAENRTGFFKDCNNTKAQVISDLTPLSTAYDNTIYNRYNMKYDNADLDIGNNISYVMLSMTVEQ